MALNFRERTLAIMAHRPVDKIVYQPRLEHWYNVNKAQGTLPARYRDMSVLDVFDDLGCSMRCYPYFWKCVKTQDDPEVRAEVVEQDGRTVIRWHTPVGSIEAHHTRTALASHTERYPVQNREDAEVLEYMLRGRTYTFDQDQFDKGDSEIGDRSAPMTWLPRINLQRLFIEYMGFENTLYALHDDKPMVDRLVKAIDETDERLVDVLCDSPIPIINFGDNIDHHFLKPETFEEYLLPAYQGRAAKFRRAGKFTNAHWDGSIKNLLPYCQQTGLDGIEALTPVPQGDITIEEMKQALGDMVLLDGIPMTSFLPHEPVEELESITRKIIEMFSPNLILGISDEPSPVCDIERVRLVADMVNGS